ncbi:MAG TPA: carbohydrate ABC transporter permease [bacterium]|nr:carbohydrate ABC transporter permease [bacterium]
MRTDRAPIALLLVVLLVIDLFPLLVMVSLSVRSGGAGLGSLGDLVPHPLSTANYAEILAKGPFARYFLNSTVVVTLVVAGNIVFASMAAYAVARTPGRPAAVMLFLIISTMMVPKHIMMIPLFSLLLGMHLVDTYYALVLPFLVDAFNVFFIYQFLKGVPREIEEAAALDGAGAWRTFARVIFPTLKPALVVTSVNTFLINWNSFLLPFVLTNSDRMRTLPVGLAIFSQGEHSVDWGLLMAGSTLAAIPTVVAFAVFQRHIVRGMTEGAVRG